MTPEDIQRREHYEASHASLVAHFTPFATGAMFLSDVGFFVTLVLTGLFLSSRALARR